jgi:Fe-S-cluster containining protein
MKSKSTGDKVNTLLTNVKDYLKKTKASRFIQSFKPQNLHRKGNCTPELCETLDGQKGSACCKLGYKCPALSGTTCGVYSVRPRNCRVFPSNEDDLKLVRNCGYYFEK